MSRLATALLAALLLSGCAMFAALGAVLKKTFIVFSLAALGALIGLAAGPLGAVVGAGTGAVVGSALDENVDLRSGALQGAGASDKEVENLKSLLMLSGDDVKAKGVQLLRAEAERQAAEQGKSLVERYWLRTLLLGGAYFGFLRREWIWKAIKKSAEGSRLGSLAHAAFGGSWTRAWAEGKRR